MGLSSTSKDFSWSNDLQGWTTHSVGFSTAQFDGASGIPDSGCIHTSMPAFVQGYGNTTGAQAYFEYSGTWESLGVTPGGTVTQVYLLEGYDKADLVGSGMVVGPYNLYYNNNLQLTLLDGRIPSANESSWNNFSNYPTQSVPSGIAASNTVIQLRIYDYLPGGYTSSVRHDQIIYGINYQPSNNGNGNASLSKSATFISYGHLAGLSTIMNSNASTSFYIKGEPNHGCTPLMIGGQTQSSVSSQNPLVIFGQTGVSNKTAPLYISSVTPINKPTGLHLFIKQTTQKYSYNTNRKLFIRGSAGIEYNTIRDMPSPSLLISGYAPDVSHSMNLFIANGQHFDYVSLLIDGSLSSTTIGKGILPLVIKGADVLSVVGPSLFIQESTNYLNSNNNPMKLFIKGPTRTNSNSPLFLSGISSVINSGQFYGNSPLYIYSNNNNGILTGDNICRMINLFVAGSLNDYFESITPLVMVGSTHPGYFSAVPLYIYGNSLTEDMNLVIKGSDSGGQSKLLRFSIYGGNPKQTHSAPLVIYNDAVDYDDSTSMFIQGAGQNPGYSPYGEALGLYVERGPTGGITLYMENKHSLANTPLYIMGSPASINTAPLFINGLGGNLVNTTPLVLKGDVFKDYNTVSTLVIPNVVGFNPGTAYLYTNGFNY